MALMPREYIVNHNQVMAYADSRWSRPREPYIPDYPLESFDNVPLELQEFAASLEGPLDLSIRPKALVLMSPTRHAKTEWARALVPDNHIYMGNDYNLDCYFEGADLFVMDDIPFHRLADTYKFFLGMQKEANLTDKYRTKKVVRRSWKGFVFLCNYDPREEKGVDRDWLEGNCHFVTLREPLVRALIRPQSPTGPRWVDGISQY